MKKIILLSLILCLSCPLAQGASSPMVERHIFSPEPDGKGVHKSPMALKLEKELVFTGVVASPLGKWAIIREKGKKNNAETSALRKEGDEIKGMIINKIGSNYVLLTVEGKEVRLNLYHEGKPRPAMPVGSESPSVSVEKTPAPAVDSSKSGATSPGIQSRSPYAQAAEPSTKPPEQTNSTPPPFPNPFQQTPPPMPSQQGAQNPFPEQNPTPVQQEPPPNPFLKTPPPNPYLKQPPDPEVK